jgi:hypothetical protein
MADFCIYIATYRGDFHYTKALCASIRYFCDDVPIVIFQDGNFSLDRLKTLGNIHEFDPNSVPPPAREITGNYSKLKALFSESYERFLYLDADTVLVGDVRELPYQDYDFFVSPRRSHLDNLEKQRRLYPHYYDYQKILEYDPEYSLEQMTLFTSGNFFGRAGRLPLEPIVEEYRYQRRTPMDQWILRNDMGLLNYFINRRAQMGEVTMGGQAFAVMANKSMVEYFPDLTLDTVLNRQFKHGYVIHFPGPTRRLWLYQHTFGDVPATFYRRYYAHFPAWVRYQEELADAPRYYGKAAFRKLYRWYKHNLRSYIRGSQA